MSNRMVDSSCILPGTPVYSPSGKNTGITTETVTTEEREIGGGEEAVVKQLHNELLGHGEDEEEADKEENHRHLLPWKDRCQQYLRDKR
jgi:hypothetical protein